MDLGPSRYNAITMSRSSDGGLRLLSVAMGVFFLCMGLSKLGWFADTGPLEAELRGWWGNAPAVSRWYIDTLAMPGLPLFARIVPFAELATGVSLLAGFRVRLVAVIAVAMVLNFHFAMGILFQWGYLYNAYGPPVLGSLAALAIGPQRLPLSLRT